MVPKGKRNTGKLAVIDKAYDLLENTYAWVANDKIIPNRHKYSIGKDILNLTLSLHNNLIFANNTKFNTLDDFLARRNFQQNASNDLCALNSLVNMSFHMFNIKDSTQSIWSGLLNEISKLLEGWIKSDSLRFEKLNKAV